MLPLSVPDAPWQLRGEAMAFMASPFHLRLLVNYHESPVGPYLEHALGTLTARGPHIFQMSVDLEASKIGGREIWGFPKELEALNWQKKGPHLKFERESQRFRLRISKPAFPLALSFWTIQNLNGEDVRVPGRIKATGQFAWCGRQLALYLANFEMIFEAPQPL